MVELRPAVGADLFGGRVQIGFRKAIRRRLQHFIRLGALLIHLIHALHDTLQYLLLSGIVLIQGGLGDPQPRCNIIHRCSKVAVLRKQLQRRFQDSFFRTLSHDFPPHHSNQSVTYSIVTDWLLGKTCLNILGSVAHNKRQRKD